MIILELNYVTLGARIAKRRKLMHLSQKDLAEQIQISNNYLSSIENGKEKPSLEIIVSICNALQVTPDYLIVGTMHSNNIPQNVVDSLRLCDEEDVELIYTMTQYLVERRSKKWNSENFI